MADDGYTLEIPETKVTGKPIAQEISDAQVDFLKGYLELKKKAKTGILTAKDFDDNEKKYNAIMEPIEKALKDAPEETTSEVRREAAWKTLRWMDKHEAERNDLKDLSIFIKNFKHQLRHAPKKDLTLSPGTDTPAELVIDMLKKNPGVAIGETHGMDTAFPLINENMAEYKKKARLGTIYIETDTESFSKYAKMSELELLKELSERTPEKVSKEKGYRPYLDKEYVDETADFLKLFLEAKRNGIRVVNMDKDGPAQEFEGNMFTGTVRVATSNYTWSEKILEDRKTRPEGETYVLIGGGGHFNSLTGTPYAGLVDDRLGLPSIFFDNRNRDSKPSIIAGINPDHNNNTPDFYLPGGECHPDYKKTEKISDLAETFKTLQETKFNRAAIASMIAGLKEQYPDDKEIKRWKMRAEDPQRPNLAQEDLMLDLRDYIRHREFNDIGIHKFQTPGCLKDAPPKEEPQELGTMQSPKTPPKPIQTANLQPQLQVR